jgi:hypothetical protein
MKTKQKDRSGRVPFLRRPNTQWRDAAAYRRSAIIFLLPLLPALLLTLTTPAAAQEDTFFLRAGAGLSIPFLGKLNDELELQGNDKVDPGYSIGISLGKSFLEGQWTLEAHFSTVFYPDFHYRNDHDSLTGKLRHYNYMAILRRNLLPEGRAFKPSIGAGLGYGLTNLISGGGKMGAAEAVFTGRIDSQIRDNVDLSLEATYYAGMQSKKFEKPFLENVENDFIMDSAGKALEDKFYSFDLRLGFTVRLMQRIGP